ncbi:MAG: phage recombination protein Bet [Turicibacter sp.]|nr:phage recombination protein Bet [Turicibacter sp.]
MTELTKYESANGAVTLDSETVKKYLVRGNGNVSDQEVLLFMNLCKFQKLNPFTNEVYLLKYSSSSPATTVVGRDAYLRRAYENPNYMGYKSGLVVQRGEAIVQKEGTCLYPGEKLVGGWCKVFQMLKDEKIETFKEVSLSEYNTGQSSWKKMPTLMICKVAESQALRAAFPKDYAGLYTPEEVEGTESPPQNEIGLAAANHKPHDYVNDISIHVPPNTEIRQNNSNINQSERQALFSLARKVFGESANERLNEIIRKYGYSSTTKLSRDVFTDIMADLEGQITESPPQNDISRQETDGSADGEVRPQDNDSAMSKKSKSEVAE